MQLGISTACLYPLETAQALEKIQIKSIPCTEIFLNTFSELEDSYIKKLGDISCRSGLKITALHPFSSPLETFFFATHYATRLADGYEFYKKYFEVCTKLNIPRLVLHGMHKDLRYPFEKYCENIAKLRDIGREFNVELCQENVVRCKTGYVKYIKAMRKYLNDDISFVLDVKQMRRSNTQTRDMVEAMGSCVQYLHLSDCDSKNDCTLPCTGSFDFAELFECLDEANFSGDGVIELYSDSFTDLSEIIKARDNLQKLHDDYKNN